MALVTNKSARVIHVDGNILVPGNQQELPDDVMDRAGVKVLVESGDLEVAKKKAAEPAPAPAAGAAPRA